MEDTRNEFITNFLLKLNNQIPDRYLLEIKKHLEIFVQNYDISKKETQIGEYTGFIPQEVKNYLVTRKIEGLSPNTLQFYKLRLVQFFEMTNKKVEEVTINDIKFFLYTIQEERHLSNRTLDSIRACLNAFFEWAALNECIAKNPCRAIKPIKYEKIKRKPLNGTEMEMIRNACKTIRERAIIEFFYSTACRVTEMERMNKDDVDFAKKEVILFGKGNKHRKSYINARCEFWLKAYLDTRTDTNESLFVYMKKPFARMKKSGIEKMVREIGERAGLDRRIFPHLIRHTSATNATNAGMPLQEVQKLLGHENINTTLIYADIADDSTKYDHKKYLN